MELRKSAQNLLEFKYGDAVFLVKPHASEEDRMSIVFAGDINGTNSRLTRAEYCRALVQRMVVGWKGVTVDGQPALYSYEALEHIPSVEGRNLFMEIGEFIIKNSDIRAGAGAEAKKE